MARKQRACVRTHLPLGLGAASPEKRVSLCSPQAPNSCPDHGPGGRTGTHFAYTGQGETGSWLGRLLHPLRVKCHHTHASFVPFPTPTISCHHPTKFLICCYSVASLVQLSVTARTAARQAPLSFTVSQSLLMFMSIESVMLSNHLIFCRPLLLLPSIFLAQDTLSLLPGAMAILSLA